MFGLVLGIFGLVASRKSCKRNRKTSEVGRGLAISGLICSSVGIVIQLFGVIGLITFYSELNITVG